MHAVHARIYTCTLLYILAVVAMRCYLSTHVKSGHSGSQCLLACNPSLVRGHFSSQSQARTVLTMQRANMHMHSAFVTSPCAHRCSGCCRGVRGSAGMMSWRNATAEVYVCAPVVLLLAGAWPVSMTLPTLPGVELLRQAVADPI